MSTSRSGRPPQSPLRGFGPPGRSLGGGIGSGGFRGLGGVSGHGVRSVLLCCCSGRLFCLLSGPTPNLHVSPFFPPPPPPVASHLVPPSLSLAVPAPSSPLPGFGEEQD